MDRDNFFKKSVISLGALLALSGCAANKVCDDYKRTLEVEARAEARWKALIEKKYDIAYTFLIDSYQSMVSEKDYRKTFNPKIQWKSYDITRTRCNEDTCEIHVTAVYHMPAQFGIPRGTDGSNHLTEKWLMKDGEWRFVPPLNK